MNEQERELVYKFPPLELLRNSYLEEKNPQVLKETALIIQQTLSNFGVKVSIAEIGVGARFTRYEIIPEVGVRIRDITSRENEIKIATLATDIHIEAPIPGKFAIGIDIANNQNRVVNIRELIESKEFIDFPSSMTCAVGMDITGNKVIADLAKMPHLLIGGMTGSGKSVFLNSLIMGFLYKASPNEVKMLMIDTKGISLTIYNGIPHMLIPVVTDARKSLATLKWCLSEMESRYRQFAEFNVRDLKGYNHLVEIDRRIPQILVIIDDLSDLMAASQKEAEELIVRLSQVSRAAGIHMIISTQRPSTNVVTGLIKANIPSRISFSVFSAIDSRTILEEKGAEKLAGNGDMLFKSIGYLKPARIQAPYVSDEEIFSVVDFLRNQAIDNVENTTEIEKSKTNIDEYFVEAGRFIIEKDKASIGMLQRFFKIGFNRAARILDELCESGVVGEEEGTKPRRILMTLREFEDLLKDRLENDIKG